MVVCSICERVVGEVGAFLPGENSDFVCLSCFRARHNHAPMPEGTQGAAQITRFGVRHRPGTKGAGKKVVYTVVPLDYKKYAGQQARRRLSKRNVVTRAGRGPPGGRGLTRPTSPSGRAAACRSRR
jgi:hypothetical protein